MSSSAISKTPSRRTRRTDAREGFIRIAKENDFGNCQLWTRVNSLDSPWLLDDLVRIVTEVGHKVDVVMIPKVEGAMGTFTSWDRLLAQLEARANLRRPDSGACAFGGRRWVWRTSEAIASASPRMQGLSLGPCGSRSF